MHSGDDDDDASGDERLPDVVDLDAYKSMIQLAARLFDTVDLVESSKEGQNDPKLIVAAKAWYTWLRIQGRMVEEPNVPTYTDQVRLGLPSTTSSCCPL